MAPGPDVTKEPRRHEYDALVEDAVGEKRQNPSYAVGEKRQTPSYLWRRYHSSWYLVGGICFAVASPMFFPSLQSSVTLSAAGWLFTIGSAAFTIADATEWWYMRAGCMFDRPNCVDDVDRRSEGGDGPGDGLNFALCMCGSFTYLVGSCYFIPFIANYSLGAEIFAAGSFMIVVAQSAKLVRAHRSCGLAADAWGTAIDVLAGLGGLFYFAGSWPDLETTATYATFFTIGGAAYFASAAAMQYRYFAPTLPLPPPSARTSLGPFVPLAA